MLIRPDHVPMYRIRIMILGDNINQLYHKLLYIYIPQSFKNQVIISLTLFINCVADGSLLEQFFSTVVVSKINRPKLYMSDLVEISPLYKYSEAMYPLTTKILVSIAGEKRMHFTS